MTALSCDQPTKTSSSGVFALKFLHYRKDVGDRYHKSLSFPQDSMKLAGFKIPKFNIKQVQLLQKITNPTTNFRKMCENL